jgi:hypothetical protein
VARVDRNDIAHEPTSQHLVPHCGRVGMSLMPPSCDVAPAIV